VSALRISGTAGLAISGNKYTNRLYSGTGADTLKGGGGADFFVFSSTAQSGPSDYDRITDFRAGTDTLNLSALDANSALAGNQAFASLGGSAKSYAVWSVKSGTSLLVYGDVTGDKIADFAVLLSNTGSIALSDIML
jgi:serralysin